MGPFAGNLKNDRQGPPTLTARGRRLGLGAAMILIAGLAVGVWLASTSRMTNGPDSFNLNLRSGILLWTVFLLGGLSLVGPPLLLMERRRRRVGPPWGAGKILWFSTGTASWLLWPPVIVSRTVPKRLGPPDGSMSEICYLYGTPLMALYVTLALLTGGWLTRRRRKRLARSWHETFGLILGLVWACTGLYVLELLYEFDLIR